MISAYKFLQMVQVMFTFLSVLLDWEHIGPPIQFHNLEELIFIVLSDVSNRIFCLFRFKRDRLLVFKDKIVVANNLLLLAI